MATKLKSGESFDDSSVTSLKRNALRQHELQRNEAYENHRSKDFSGQ